MAYHRILTVQDISCVGQCSITVALPILSACGMETAILPSAVLSTHTGGFTGYTFRDLTDDIPGLNAHWIKQGLTFDAIYTGYLGSARQIDMVLHLADTVLTPGCPLIVDPAMADNGKLYYGFDDEFVAAMRRLVARADYILPNITEASFLTGETYKDAYDEAYIDRILRALRGICGGTIVLTGVGFAPDRTGVMVEQNGEKQYYEHKKHPRSSHGTGDVYAAAFAGALLNGHSAIDAAAIAADYTLACIEATADDPDHTYGVKFEIPLPALIARARNV